MIANRLKCVLPRIIDPYQLVFILGHLIIDNALITFEIFHSMHHNKCKKHNSFAFKLNMNKAYDRVEWILLERVMLKLSFDSFLVQLIMRCVTSVSISILINGQPDALIPSRGLR